MAKEENIKARIGAILQIFKEEYPTAKTSLHFDNPFQLLVATVLSAQCTDARVNLVTPKLFARFSTPQAFAKANRKELEQLVKSTGFYRNKTKAILEISKELVARYNGKVPQTMEALIGLRGIGRKTANVVLGNAFNIPGIPVDTHVGRLCFRLGFSASKDPVKIEFDLMQLVPKRDWVRFSHLLIEHGRSVCKARKPSCQNCQVSFCCPKKGVKKF
ncbi:MAG: endonuclease III [Bdellovibrionales bacterium RIFOXYD1_FULL_44_7]|nr:MAG: endonuclease III [Bdellovibrionales bacterium RIFOXYD1_FULL_44_7]